MLRVSWTAKKTNVWVLNKAGVKTELLDTVKARKLAYYGHTMRKKGSCLEKEIMQGTMPGARRRGRPRTAWMDDIKTWTGLSVEESIRMTEDRDKWRKYVHGVDGSRTAKEQEQDSATHTQKQQRLRGTLYVTSTHSLVKCTPPLNPVSKCPLPRPPARICALITYSRTSVDSNKQYCNSMQMIVTECHIYSNLLF